MASMKLLCVALPLLVVFHTVNSQLVTQKPRMPKIISFRAGSFNKAPNPSRVISGSAKDRLNALKNNPLLNVRTHCNLKRLTPYRDPAMGRVISAQSVDARSSAVANMAVSRAVRAKTPEADAVRTLQSAARRAAASAARVSSQQRANRTRRQAALGVEHLTETIMEDPCPPKDMKVVTVLSGKQTCYVIPPQDVRFRDCASNFVRGMTNPSPFMQKFYCEPGVYANTAFYVICPFERDVTKRIQIAELDVPINCACLQYKCNFEPYQADSPLEFS